MALEQVCGARGLSKSLAAAARSAKPNDSGSFRRPLDRGSQGIIAAAR